MTIYQRLQPIFQEVFDDDDIVPTPEIHAGVVDAWDSLSHIRLMVAIEQEFNIRFELSEVTDLPNLGELVAVIERKIA